MDKLRFIFGLTVIIFVFVMIAIGYGYVQKENLAPEADDEVSEGLGDAIITNVWIADSAKLDKIRENDIRVLIVDIGDISLSGEILNKNQVRAFIKRIKEYEEANKYNFIVLPYSEIGTNKFTLDENFLENLKEQYIWLGDEGFDGAYVDIEPVKFSQRDKYLAFLSDLKESLGKDSIVGVYSGFHGDFRNSRNEWEWTNSYFHSVCGRVDLITIPVYDTSFTEISEYRKYIKMNVREISSQMWNCSFLLGIPTHKENPETLENAFDAYKEESVKYPNTPFLGVAIFSEWTISEYDWERYSNIKKLNQVVRLN
jgi:hypothetical protein